MIYCPECGTANRDGSKFCNECGNRLVPPPVPEEPRGEEKPPRLAEVLDVEATPPYDEAAFGPPLPEGEELPPSAGIEAGPKEGQVSPEASVAKEPRPPGEEVEPAPEAAAPEEPDLSPAEEELLLEAVAAEEMPLEEGALPPEAITPEMAAPGLEEVTPPAEAAAPGKPEPQPEEAPSAEVAAPEEPAATVVSEVAPSIEEETPVVTRPPASSPLASIADSIPVATLVIRRHLPGAVEPLSTSLAEIEEARLLAEIAAPPVPSEPVAPVVPRALDWDRVRLWLIYVVIFLAVAVPLAVPGGLAHIPSEAPATDRAFRVIEDLPEGALVVVSFDYDPGMAGEMRLLAEVVIEHLVRRRARLIIVSLSPEGPALAQQVLDEIVSHHPAYVYGETYLHVGYLPGGEAALRSLALNPRIIAERDYLTGRPLSDWLLAQDLRLDRVALIVELAGTQASLRQWVEQVQRIYGSPMVAGISAAVEPHAWPYYLSGQLRGLVSGLPGASTYEAYLGHVTEKSPWLASQSVAHLVLIALIVLGMVGRWLAARRS